MLYSTTSVWTEGTTRTWPTTAVTPLDNQQVEAGARFDALAVLFNPSTFRHIDALGIADGWRCGTTGQMSEEERTEFYLRHDTFWA
jgi:hypothetical protein